MRVVATGGDVRSGSSTEPGMEALIDNIRIEGMMDISYVFF